MNRSEFVEEIALVILSAWALNPDVIYPATASGPDPRKLAQTAAEAVAEFPGTWR